MRTPRVEIEYCTQCRWLLRAAWVQQELLTTFGTRLGEVALVPGTGGVFRVVVTAEPSAEPVLVWDRAADGSFPELPQLKARIRDVVAPDLALGHTDRAARRGDPDDPAPERAR
ncbi:SelT/SelW/SelH family protein [Luteimicrobium subarcticum]|uniref:Selenoprotein W-related protein n=1 Tax=Luteimicrobium subarcticum TaxID=620910 RepID=A0A2M8WT91_9MICO|nr:SelT/SelW/SelH family protein [Luteimicrobium subarcticum]PJI94160.1 selenoprotein W-related protein [Luteimicrobium subarcticum]